MILINATIKYKGYNPDDLKLHSNKKICCVCDNCDRVRWVPKNNYSNLCRLCSINPLKPKFIPEEKDRFFKDTKIDRIITIEKMNYDPIDLKEKSPKKVWSICEKCGNGRLVRFYPYHNICKKCINQGRILTPEHKANISKNSARLSGKDNGMFGKYGKLNPAWKGGLPLRDHVKHENQCIQLNFRFEGCEGHHITSGVIIYIPKDIHFMNHHDLKNNKGMKEINNLAMDYLMGDY